jgi:hypothetical protein
MPLQSFSNQEKRFNLTIKNDLMKYEELKVIDTFEL